MMARCCRGRLSELDPPVGRARPAGRAVARPGRSGPLAAQPGTTC